MSSQPPITLTPTHPSNYLTIASLIETAFSWEELGIVAFGPKRNTPSGLSRRAEKMARPCQPGERRYEMNAVIREEAKEGGWKDKIVGFAGWVVCVGRRGSEGELESKDEKGREGDERDEGNEEIGVEQGHGNPNFRKEVLGRMDKKLIEATKGKDYMSLTMLAVDPEYQRQGIGSMLFEDGLKIADEAGLQVVLGASKKGVGLYKKFWCVEFDVLRIDLGEWEGGEGLGMNEQVLLRRPARGE